MRTSTCGHSPLFVERRITALLRLRVAQSLLAQSVMPWRASPAKLSAVSRLRRDLDASRPARREPPQRGRGANPLGLHRFFFAFTTGRYEVEF